MVQILQAVIIPRHVGIGWTISAAWRVVEKPRNINGGRLPETLGTEKKMKRWSDGTRMGSEQRRLSDMCACVFPVLRAKSKDSE